VVRLHVLRPVPLRRVRVARGEATGPTAIASTYFPTFKNTFSAIQIRGTSPAVAGPDILSTDIPFVAKDDGTNPPWKVEYTSH
jgi:hypothetical protein